MTLTLSTRTGSPAGIIGVGAYRPTRVVPNSEICEHIESSDEWIQERSGIIERRFAAPEENVVTMGAEAASRAISNSGISASDVDAVIVATFTHRFATPSAAAEIASLIGATDAGAFDVSAACAGFCYAIGLADSMIQSGQAKNVVVIGSEKLSDVLDLSDRGTAFIFADGAGAVVVSGSVTQGIGPTVWGSDGASKEAIIMSPDSLEAQARGVRSVLTMEGQRVFRWAVGSMGGVCKDAMAAAGVQPTDIKAFVPHQANLRITTALMKNLGLNDDVVVAKDIQYTGNTSAASVPLALDALKQTGEVKSGDLILMVGFGAGLAYAAQVAIAP